MDLAYLARQPQQGVQDARVGQTVAVDLSGPGGVARTLALPRGKSAVIELPVEATFASVTDPKVANIEVSSPRKYVVMGLSAGQTDAIFAAARSPTSRTPTGRCALLRPSSLSRTM